MALTSGVQPLRFYSSTQYNILPPGTDPEPQYEEISRGNSRRASSDDRDQESSAKDTTASLEPSFSVKRFRVSDYGGQTNYEPLLANNDPPQQPPRSIGALITHNLSTRWTIICCLLRLTTANLQLSILIYLSLSYLKLPRTLTGQLPQIQGLYASTPFISCIGSLHLATYRSIVIPAAVCMTLVDATLFYSKFTNPIAYWIRRITILSSISALTFAIWLSLVLNDPSTHLHLTLIACHSLSVLSYKISGLATDHALRAAFALLRTDPVALCIRQWKEATVLFAAPMALLLTMGVFSCHVGEMQQDVMTPGTTCYRVLSIAGQVDWVYALVTVNWSVLMGFEVFMDEYLAGIVARSRMEDMIAPMVAVRYEHDADREDSVREAVQGPVGTTAIRMGVEAADSCEVERKTGDEEWDGERWMEVAERNRL